MNGLNFENVALGAALSQDVAQENRLLFALTAGMMPKGNLLGVITLSQLKDRLVNEEAQRATAQEEASQLRREIAVELPTGADTVTLRIPSLTSGVAFARTGGSDGAQVNETTGVVTLPTAGNEISLTITAGGVARPLVIRRAAVSPEGTPTGAGGDGRAGTAQPTPTQPQPQPQPGSENIGRSGARHGRNAGAGE